MGNAFGEIPDVAVPHLFDLVCAVLAYGRYSNGAVVEETLLSLYMEHRQQETPIPFLSSANGAYHPVPMELPKRFFLQMLLGSGDISA